VISEEDESQAVSGVQEGDAVSWGVFFSVMEYLRNNDAGMTLV
jgi:hypothetical protein